MNIKTKYVPRGLQKSVGNYAREKTGSIIFDPLSGELRHQADGQTPEGMVNVIDFMAINLPQRPVTMTSVREAVRLIKHGGGSQRGIL